MHPFAITFGVMQPSPASNPSKYAASSERSTRTRRCTGGLSIQRCAVRNVTPVALAACQAVEDGFFRKYGASLLAAHILLSKFLSFGYTWTVLKLLCRAQPIMAPDEVSVRIGCPDRIASKISGDLTHPQFASPTLHHSGWRSEHLTLYPDSVTTCSAAVSLSCIAPRATERIVESPSNASMAELIRLVPPVFSSPTTRRIRFGPDSVETMVSPSTHLDALRGPVTSRNCFNSLRMAACLAEMDG